MVKAAENGHIEIVKLCKEWGATNFNGAMILAAKNGHVEVMKLCKEWGVTYLDYAMILAAENGHIETVKLYREWLGFDLIHRDLFRYHHKRRFSRKIHEDLLPIAWHPYRFWNWCVDKEEKGFLEEMCRVADCASKS